MDNMGLVSYQACRLPVSRKAKLIRRYHGGADPGSLAHHRQAIPGGGGKKILSHPLKSLSPPSLGDTGGCYAFWRQNASLGITGPQAVTGLSWQTLQNTLHTGFGKKTLGLLPCVLVQCISSYLLHL